MKNIIYLSGSDMFPRIKIGVGKKPHPDYDLKDWVLSKFSSLENKTLGTIYENAVDAVELMVNEKTSEAMQRYN
jgi:PTH1 family peptidyl-tRNA hydrolase